jgi:hypothetical protein
LIWVWHYFKKTKKVLNKTVNSLVGDSGMLVKSGAMFKDKTQNKLQRKSDKK